MIVLLPSAAKSLKIALSTTLPARVRIPFFGLLFPKVLSKAPFAWALLTGVKIVKNRAVRIIYLVALLVDVIFIVALPVYAQS